MDCRLEPGSVLVSCQVVKIWNKKLVNGTDFLVSGGRDKSQIGYLVTLLLACLGILGVLALVRFVRYRNNEKVIKTDAVVWESEKLAC